MSRPVGMGDVVAALSVTSDLTRGHPPGETMRACLLAAATCLLAAADVLHAIGEPRPHRAALDAREASGIVSGLPLDRDSVRAVLDAVETPRPSFPPLPADITERELDVLRLLVAGRTERAIAGELFLSPSTVHTHFVLEGDRVRSVDQFVGDPAAVTAFWA